MKTTQEIAQAVLNRRQRANATILPGDLIAEIGSEGVHEALSHRWVMPDFDNGYLQVTNDLGTITEIREAASKPAESTANPVNEYRAMSEAHALRGDNGETLHTCTLETLGLGGGGAAGPANSTAPVNSSPTGASPATPAKPVPPVSPTTGGAQKPHAIGDAVTVVENGQAYTGMIASAQNGKFKLSFAGNKPVRDREYATEEIQPLPAQPGAPHQ